MPVAALLIYCASLTLTFGVRIALQWRRTGSTGVHGLPAGASAIEWLAGGAFLTSLVAGAASPLLVLLDVLEPIAALDGAVGHVAGTVLAVGGLVLTFAAQLAMGDAWRIGVDPQERTELVTGGPFALVRNPIYSAMLPTIFGLALMVPTGLALATFAALLAALEVQVRLVEEPYLRRTHGDEYAAYAARVGRFVPGVGRTHAIAACAVALAILTPAPAARADVIGAFGAFHLRASHGFKITVLADSRRADGRGEVLIFVTRHRAGASYFAPATVTDSRIEADLGGLGKIDVAFVPSGGVVEERSSCGDGFVQFEDGAYQGTIEFHGEQGFTDASASRVRVEVKPFLDFGCFGSGEGESIGRGQPGARIGINRGDKQHRLHVQVNENRPGARLIYSAELHERYGQIAIDRSVEGALPGSGFLFDVKRGTATLAPGGPFSGRAAFRREAPTSGRWLGSLAIDFPGRANTPLTGAGTKVTLVPARHEFH